MEQISSVDVILDNLHDNPQCPHGPTLLFKRVSKGKEQKFYACSACRDKKDCSFYLRFEDEWSAYKENVWRSRAKDVLPQIDHNKLFQRFLEISKLSPNNRAFCHTCNALLAAGEINMHQSHDLLSTISDFQLLHPSSLIKPFESAAKEAQYLFSSKTVEAIVNMIRGAGVRRVLCIGCPRVHEHIRSEQSADMASILLDFDHRYHHFFEESQFLWFNVFNCHWFAGEKAKAIFMEFMRGASAEQFAIVTDPPFGGRVEPLLLTFQRLDEMHKEIHPQRDGPLSLFWIFPYFMEGIIAANSSNISMLDYKVDYVNHPLFHEGVKGRKYGSPVRIFTNVSPAKLPLPEDDGYWFCKICSRWSSRENRHCSKCKCCTSKNGTTYIHCDKCKRCEKPSRKHCSTCDRCCMQDHKCGTFRIPVCYICHKPDHKKNECPLRITSEDGNSANGKRNRKMKVTTRLAHMQKTENSPELSGKTGQKRKHNSSIVNKDKLINKKRKMP